jgi:hypothetical protein
MDVKDGNREMQLPKVGPVLKVARNGHGWFIAPISTENLSAALKMPRLHDYRHLLLSM